MVLGQRFIGRSNYLAVASHNKQCREERPLSPEHEAYYDSFPSSVVQCAIEVKMASLRDSLEISAPQVNQLEDSMLAACCKLAQEHIPNAYILGLSHGPLPDPSRAYQMVAGCLQLYSARYPAGCLRVAVATPTQTVLGGDWLEETEFPNLAFARGYPAGQEEAP